MKRFTPKDTGNGVEFVTLENEMGAAIVWRDLGDRQRRKPPGAKLLAAYAIIEREQGLLVLAGPLADLSPPLGRLQPKSREVRQVCHPPAACIDRGQAPSVR